MYHILLILLLLMKPLIDINKLWSLRSGALNGKMLHVRIIENNKIDTYFRLGKVS